MPDIGQTDQFEDFYMAKLRSQMSTLGQFIKYEKDVAALDLGLHLYETNDEVGSKKLSNVRVWIQAKGIQASTLPATSLENARSVAVEGLRTDHVEYWYAAAEPVYLAVYVESLDTFLIDDVRSLVQEQLDPAELRVLASVQKTVTLRIPTDRTLERAVPRLQLHRSMRIDMKAFRGRPLGHGFDPLRSAFDPPAADTFTDLVADILEAHEFRQSEAIDSAQVFESCPKGSRIVRGSLLLTYEWTSPIFTEYGYDEGSEFRIESAPQHIQGDVVVIIAPGSGIPRMRPDLSDLLTRWRNSGVERILVFYNGSDMDAKLFGSWRAPFLLCGVPQGIGSITFNVLTMTNVYLKYSDRLRFAIRNYL